MRIRYLLAGLAIAAATVPALAADGPHHRLQRSISVQGEGVVSARPDMAVIQAGVSGQAATAKSALSQHNLILTRLLAALKTFGIADRDVQSQQVNLHPVYSRRPQNDEVRTPKAFRANGRVRVRLRQVDRLGDLLDNMTAAGANDLSGLHFAFADPAALHDQARRRAMADARRRALLYAGVAGVELGEVLRIRESGGGGPGPRFRALEAVSAASPTAPGESQIRATVSVVYAIK